MGLPSNPHIKYIDLELWEPQRIPDPGFLLLLRLPTLGFGRQMAVPVLRQISWSQFLLFELEGVYLCLKTCRGKGRANDLIFFSLAKIQKLQLFHYRVTRFQNPKYQCTILRFLCHSRIALYVCIQAKQILMSPSFTQSVADHSHWSVPCLFLSYICTWKLTSQHKPSQYRGD